MNEELLKHSKFLSKVCKSDGAKRKQILENASPGELQVLCEILLNIYNRNLKVPKSTITKLLPFKSIIKRLLSKKISSTKRKFLLCQKGGFLPILAPAITALLSSVLF